MAKQDVSQILPDVESARVLMSLFRIQGENIRSVAGVLESPDIEQNEDKRKARPERQDVNAISCP